jgi:hypothetical protein
MNSCESCSFGAVAREIRELISKTEQAARKSGMAEIERKLQGEDERR